MRVRMTFSVDVNMAEWVSEYGSGESAAEIREDVRSYFLTLMQDSRPVEVEIVKDVRQL